MTYQEAASWLLTQDQYLILTHVRPDGDTVGCAAALCRALREQGKTAYILPNVQIHRLFSDYVSGMLAPERWTAEYIISVDLAAKSLFPDNAKKYLTQVDLAIDHHPSQEFFAKETCVDAARAACGELVYDIIRQWGPVSKEAAIPLYVAVATDCGCFAYGNTTADTHRVAAALIDAGIPVAALNKKHFRTKSLTRLKLESALIDTMELHDNGTIALVTLSLALLHQLHADETDTEDISALAGAIEGVKTSVTLREQPNGQCKLSVRTDPNDLDASKVCALLGGGGHAAAAGALIDGDITEAKRAILAAIHQVHNT